MAIRLHAEFLRDVIENALHKSHFFSDCVDLQ